MNRNRRPPNRGPIVRRLHGPDRRARQVSAFVVILMGLALNACRSRQQMLTEQQKALISLRATTVALSEAWLAGNASSTYVRTALEATQQLLEKQRVELTTSPDVLADPKAAALSEWESAYAKRGAALESRWRERSGRGAPASDDPRRATRRPAVKKIVTGRRVLSGCSQNGLEFATNRWKSFLRGGRNHE
jgi:hypothetical protein